MVAVFLTLDLNSLNVFFFLILYVQMNFVWDFAIVIVTMREQASALQLTQKLLLKVFTLLIMSNLSQSRRRCASPLRQQIGSFWRQSKVISPVP